ncbi:MAG: sigma-70 family RNA polymerase sigma factor [Chitinophagaceae bacterium]|nr:MAG: sigma-70 family RNA polymerase sigma factor [Chitinophagaceae bacterium]
MEQATTILTAMVKKARQGDEDAKAWLYRQYSETMFNICMRMAGNKVNAEDLLQDAFIKAFTNLSQLKQPEIFGGWLRRITVIECLRHGKRTINWKQLDDERQSVTEDDPGPWWADISMALVNEAIRELPNGCRQVFVLYALEDYRHQDIAKELGISESTSKSQYQRARQLLKDQLTKKTVHHG